MPSFDFWLCRSTSTSYLIQLTLSALLQILTTGKSAKAVKVTLRSKLHQILYFALLCIRICPVIFKPLSAHRQHYRVRLGAEYPRFSTLIQLARAFSLARSVSTCIAVLDQRSCLLSQHQAISISCCSAGCGRASRGSMYSRLSQHSDAHCCLEASCKIG